MMRSPRPWLAVVLAVAALVPALAGCGVAPQVHTTGTVTGSQAFQFKNFADVTVEGTGLAYDWREFHVRDGNAFRVPFAELRITLASGEVLLTDRDIGNGELSIDGKLVSGSRFLLRADRSLEVLPGEAGLLQAVPE